MKFEILFQSNLFWGSVFFFLKRLNTQLLESTEKLEKNENEVSGVGAESQRHKQ